MARKYVEGEDVGIMNARSRVHQKPCGKSYRPATKQ